MKSTQLILLKQKTYSHRKVARPVHVRGWNHVTVKARIPVLRAHHMRVRKIIRDAQIKYGVRLKSVAIMETHLHLLIAPPSRESFANFMKYIASRIALAVGKGKLWLTRCWSRLVRWGKDLVGVTRYIELNPSQAGCFGDEDLHIIRSGILEIRVGWS